MLKQPSIKQALNSLFTKSSVKEAQVNDQSSNKQALNKAVAEPESSPESNPESSPKNSPKNSPESNPESNPESTQQIKPNFALGIAMRLSGLPKRKYAFAVIGLLGASSGLAFTQVDSLQAAIAPNPANIPLSRANDPAAEPVLETQDLFLTNEIFYRKVEAIAQIPRSQTQLGDPLQKGIQAAKPGAATPTGATAANAKAAAEQVAAAAPPAPKAAPTIFTGTTIDNALEMRVAVAKDVSAIAFATSGSGTLIDLDGNIIQELSAETSALAEIGNGIVVDGQTMPGAFWVYPEDGGYVAIGDSWYRGRVLIALRERGLIAVNYVLLGDYLYSVVGTEMSPSWAIESLKAQAVAARSYALTHNIRPASEEYFDLDNTERFQAYKGIAREANTTQAAVQATAGEFISHEGGIVESLYAASQAIVDEVHRGSGMSQNGARELAEQGYSYIEILGHYYPGTALGRLETEAE